MWGGGERGEMRRERWNRGETKRKWIERERKTGEREWEKSINFEHICQTKLRPYIQLWLVLK